MKTIFTKQEILQSKGCYTTKQVEQLSFINNQEIDIQTIFESEISIKDKRWFIYNNCDLTLDEKKKLSLQLAWAVLPIYEKKYPNDLRIRECLQATEDFYSGKVSLDFLIEKRKAAAYVAYVAYVATYVAKETYSQKLQQIFIDFIK